jgi:translation initiation factor 2B subunit (eIF-2B alpha/beta/delta family)
MCRRVLHIVREEAEHAARQPVGSPGDSPGRGPPAGGDFSDDSFSDEDSKLLRMKRFKSEVIEAIGELIDELDSVVPHVAQQALEHVVPSSVVLTAGGDAVVEAFLKEANKKRTFQLVVCEGGPELGGHRVARALADKGVETTVISDAAAYAAASGASLVVLRARGIFRNGGALVRAGDRAVAVAAKEHAVPVIVLAGTHELSPLGPGDDAFERCAGEMRSPARIVSYAAMEDCLEAASDLDEEEVEEEEAARARGGAKAADEKANAASAGGLAAGMSALALGSEGGARGGGGPGERRRGGRREGGGAALAVANPAFDYLPPALVDAVLTDAGGTVPGFVETVMGEIYSLPADRTFE